MIKPETGRPARQKATNQHASKHLSLSEGCNNQGQLPHCLVCDQPTHWPRTVVVFASWSYHVSHGTPFKFPRPLLPAFPRTANQLISTQQNTHALHRWNPLKVSMCVCKDLQANLKFLLSVPPSGGTSLKKIWAEKTNQPTSTNQL